MHGSDEPACLAGKITCNTFKYACRVDGNGSDVTMVITYPQEYYEEYIEIGLNVRNLKLIGQVEDGYTFTCTSTDNGSMSIISDSMGYPKQLWLENVQMYYVGGLSIGFIDGVKLTGFIGQGLRVHVVSVKTVHVEDSTFESLIYIGSIGDLTSFTVKNSSLHLVYKEQKGRVLEVYILGGNEDISILFEKTDFTLTQPPPPDQLAPILLKFQTYSNINISVNFTISKCNFFNYNSTTLEVDVRSATSVEDIYLNILDSKFRVPQKYILI
jgi:hypothetical protein